MRRDDRSSPDERGHDEENVPLADRRSDPEVHDVPDFGEEATPSATDPDGRPKGDPRRRVYGGDEGWEPPTQV
ncbi:hypothetical protein [Spongiactinospora sp. TRM90649]|uniref:hypothetical protein n=1 Tax=Spongiactinospora sp. TRM90649 TaxID=3031114 RepID=UPI0023F97B72|nr:hypothetical protein [Spongiactinospora sp. TRM90649]MDF5759146.1 hypothetical protein [Spongiactinospora sp. TRM90649]